MPVREYRALMDVYDGRLRGLAWQVIVAQQFKAYTPNLTEAITISSPSNDDARLNCPEIKRNFYSFDDEHTILTRPSGPAVTQLVVFKCEGKHLSSRVSIDGMSYHKPRDLVVSVNFTGIRPQSNAFGPGQSIHPKALQVYAGLVDDSPNIFATATQPTVLLPGMNFLGLVTSSTRKRFRQPKFSSFGFFDTYDTFTVAEMNVLPLNGMMGEYQPTDPDISTLHLTYQGPPFEWKIVQDYREKSVLAGFSAVGGLGSFFSLLCAVLFGTSLFSIVLRAKPFSAFGLLHSVDTQRKEIASVSMTKYPKLEAELKALETEENRGVIALLLDTLLDLDLIKEQLGKSQSSGPRTRSNLEVDETA
ncbi:hypothetical protein MD484_g8568, partial [Candolleomyces efflorescens]